MTTEGIEAVFLETHNWGKSAKFFQGLGYEVEFATDHNSGQLRRGDGPYLFIAEIPETEPTRTPRAGGGRCRRVRARCLRRGRQRREDTHWGTRLMTIRDPDGREWKLQAPQK